MNLKGIKHKIHILRSREVFKGRKSLVFLHGFMGTSLIYSEFLKPLCKEFNIYAIDIPGMGLSTLNDFRIE